MFTYETTEIKVLGLELFQVVLSKNGVKIAVSQFNSKGLCIQWAANQSKKFSA